jgi:hypothetical protein
MTRPLALLAAVLVVAGAALIVVSPPARASGSFNVDLDGAQEVPGPGDPDGTGSANLSIDLASDQFCYSTAFVSGVDGPLTGAHIHAAPTGEAGPIVVTLDPARIGLTPPGPSGESCLTIDGGLAEDIVTNPASYYLNVHNAAFPDGAVRGQLQTQAVLLEAIGGGSQEVPGPGDPDGTLTATFRLGFDPSSPVGGGSGQNFCYQVNATGITSPPTAMHLHQAPAGQAGAIVLTLDPATVNSGAERCPLPESDADYPSDALIEALAADPSAYYLNVHTSDFPDGAVRAQLAFQGTTPTTSPPTTSAPTTTAALPRSVPAGSGGEAAPSSGSDWVAVLLIGAGAGLVLLSAIAWRRRDPQAGSA